MPPRTSARGLPQVRLNGRPARTSPFIAEPQRKRRRPMGGTVRGDRAAGAQGDRANSTPCLPMRAQRRRNWESSWRSCPRSATDQPSAVAESSAQLHEPGSFRVAPRRCSRLVLFNRFFQPDIGTSKPWHVFGMCCSALCRSCARRCDWIGLLEGRCRGFAASGGSRPRHRPW